MVTLSFNSPDCHRKFGFTPSKDRGSSRFGTISYSVTSIGEFVWFFIVTLHRTLSTIIRLVVAVELPAAPCCAGIVSVANKTVFMSAMSFGPDNSVGTTDPPTPEYRLKFSTACRLKADVIRPCKTEFRICGAIFIRLKPLACVRPVLLRQADTPASLCKRSLECLLRCLRPLVGFCLADKEWRRRLVPPYPAVTRCLFGTGDFFVVPCRFLPTLHPNMAPL